MIHSIRAVLALPLLVAQYIVMIIGSGMQGATKLFYRASRGLANHIYYPIVVARRLVAGEPRWKPIDLAIGIQPRTADARSVADTDPTVQKIECSCGRSDCGGPFYVLKNRQIEVSGP